jgi:magnesium chelatase family protein
LFAKIASLGLAGIEAFPISVEVDFHRGLPVFEIVGLPDASVKEARDRVKAAMGNCGLDLPPGRIVVNLAPADVRKQGALYDLPILVGVLVATGQLPAFPEDSVLVGELSLSGEVRPCSGVLSMALESSRRGVRRFYLPALNAAEGAAVKRLEVCPVAHVEELLCDLRGEKAIPPMEPTPFSQEGPAASPDFREVRGQLLARRAAEIAAAGNHNLILIGPPGSGKSMIAQRLPSILPPLTFEEAMDTARIYSVAGLLEPGRPMPAARPFRAPHHSVSGAGLCGGGSPPKPGEISLAHNGVLFLDELPEFSRPAMEAMRQPLEDGRVSIVRAGYRLHFPSDCMLVAAMNPCPCGYFGHPTHPCSCSQTQRLRYIGKVSGPLLDRVDLVAEAQPVQFEQLAGEGEAESSEVIRARVLAARERQLARQAQTGADCNARLSPSAVRMACQLEGPAHAFLERAFHSLGLSARAYDRVLKVARTIADLDGADRIGRRQIAEAVQYRGLDRKYWGSGE